MLGLSLPITFRSKKITIFDPTFEKANIFSGMIVLAVLAVLQGFHLGRDLPLIFYLLYSHFFGLFHSYLTFLLFAKIPEGRGFVSESRKNGAAWTVIVVVFAVSLFLFEYATKMQYVTQGLLIDLAEAFFVMLLAHHFICQINGLRLLYNRRALETAGPETPDGMQIRKLDKIENVLFKVAIVAVTTRPLLSLLAKHNDLGSEFNSASFYFQTILVSVILLFACSYPQSFHSNKPYFLLRLLLYPFSHFLPVSILMMRYLHWIEYMCVFSKMCRASSEKPRGNQVMGWFVLSILPIGFLTLPQYVHSYFVRLPSEFFAGLLALGFVISYLHCYFDHVLFRMKDPLARKYFGPLL